MKCNQTGKLFTVKVTSLTRADEGSTTMDNLVEGEQLLMTANKEYPVTVQCVVSALADATVERKYDN